MLQDIERLQLAALLHDIGKFRQRTIATPPSDLTKSTVGSL